MLLGLLVTQSLSLEETIRTAENGFHFSTTLVGFLVLVKVESAKYHVGEFVVESLVSLLVRDPLELLLIGHIRQDIVSGVTIHIKWLLLLSVDLNLWRLSSIASPELLKVSSFNTVDSENEVVVDLASVPDLLVVAC